MDSGKSLNDSKLKEYQEVFSMFDNNQDGVITSCEVNKVFSKINKNFSDFPLSKNGIEFSEFLKLMTEEKSESEIEELKVAFKVFDLDGTGKISRQELESALKNLGENINDKNLNVILKTLDLDGDGKISFEEFIKFLNS